MNIGKEQRMVYIEPPKPMLKRFGLRSRWLRFTEGLDRFEKAQNARWLGVGGSSYERARNELVRGQKQGHWMWWIFPQERGLGRSWNSAFYGLTKYEARRYLDDDVLGTRLIVCASEVISWLGQGRRLEQIFGPLDAEKFRSCMELFASVSDIWVFTAWQKYETVERRINA